MKKFILLIIAFGFIHSCTEVLPVRNIQVALVDTTFQKSTTSARQDRIVMVEEFTGASCVNCPAGHATLKAIESANGNRVISYGLHFGALAVPVHSEDPDLKIPEAEQISTFFGVSSMPNALIDRAKPNGTYVFGRSAWSNAVNNRLAVPAKANIKTSISFNQLISKYVLSIEIELLEEITDNLSYTVAIVENNIIAGQLSGSTVIEKYNHAMVARKFITSALGSSLKKPTGVSSYLPGRTYKKEIPLDLNTAWKAEDLHIITFVANDASREILQANEIHLK
jgi:hypothetical protein